jgi:hypothetical protein
MSSNQIAKTVSQIKIVNNKIVKSSDNINLSNKRALSESPPQSPIITDINKSKKIVTLT